jgi:two-component system, NarL family, response regulator DevR
VIHIALLDDHPAVVAGLHRLIEPEHDLTVVAAGATAPELVQRLDGARADVLVLDHDPARGDAFAHCWRIKQRPHPPAVVIYSAYAGPASLLAARAAQADAVVDKVDDVRVLLAAIRAAARGETKLPPVPREAFEAAVNRLDDDELPIFAMLLEREPVDVIAHTLGTERSEVSWRVQRIIGRLRPKLRNKRDAHPAARDRPA